MAGEKETPTTILDVSAEESTRISENTSAIVRTNFLLAQNDFNVTNNSSDIRGNIQRENNELHLEKSLLKLKKAAELTKNTKLLNGLIKNKKLKFILNTRANTDVNTRNRPFVKISKRYTVPRKFEEANIPLEMPNQMANNIFSNPKAVNRSVRQLNTQADNIKKNVPKIIRAVSSKGNPGVHKKNIFSKGKKIVVNAIKKLIMRVVEITVPSLIKMGYKLLREYDLVGQLGVWMALNMFWAVFFGIKNGIIASFFELVAYITTGLIHRLIVPIVSKEAIIRIYKKIFEAFDEEVGIENMIEGIEDAAKQMHKRHPDLLKNLRIFWNINT